MKFQNEQLTPKETQESLNTAVEKFERENPKVAEAMRVMNISYRTYLAALSTLQKAPSSATNTTDIKL